MILQALYDYYERKPDLPKGGFESKEIPFIFELSSDGNVIQIEDTRESRGKKKVARSFLVPQGVKKSVNVAANLLWGNAEYVLGLPDPKKLAEQGGKGREDEYRVRLAGMNEAFLAAIRALPPEPLSDEGVQAVLKFLTSTDLKAGLELTDIGREIGESNPNVTFRLQGDVGLVCQRRVVRQALGAPTPATSTGTCMVTGAQDEIERLHPSIKGVRDAQSSGANVISFNLDAFRSFGKERGANAPVGKRAAFAYTTALNHLLRRDSPQKLQVGDATTVFWAERDSSLENEFSSFFDEPPKDDPDRGVRAVTALLQAARHGVGPFLDDKSRFFVLGLSPNAARIAIRFWHVGTVAEMAVRIVRHFHDVEIVHGAHDKLYLSIFRLLVASAAQGKADNLAPNLGGEVMRAILAGLPYPDTLMQGALRRIRAEHEISYPRAAILKACLNRRSDLTEKEMTVSLDKENLNPGYRLGRLFAVLERVQEEANPGINATIRDRFYGAASSTPAAVFPNLMRLKNHHLAKLENPGRRVNLEKLIGEIVNGLSPAFPPHLPLDNQGRFAIGYYHQRMDKSTYTNQGE
ncbi:MAG: type I-C CRISPR-associated protein Cas8c/Csd1 [Betaproteobacteria bacterium]|nr:type I-C CRISPR-associated protein Cas8c/Csd1 [Betaproteobacteria bacterium]